MTKSELLTWLRANKDYLNISAIGRAAGVPSLRNVVNGNADGHGREASLADKHVDRLINVVNEITSSAPPVPASAHR